MSLVLNGTTGITNLPSINSGQIGGSRNKIINGAMVIDQRNAGAVVTPGSGGYTLDRWQALQSAASKFSVQQTPSATETGYAARIAAGFTSYLAVTSLSAYSVSSSDYYSIRQSIEGFNISDLAWGTSSAKTITISALVYSSLTGTFGGSIQNSANNYNYPFSYSIPVANTWTQISVTIAGPTSGAFLTTNAVGFIVNFGLGVGSTFSGTAGTWAATNVFSATGAVSVVGTSGATFYITGVQLEKGSTATEFEHRSFGEELALCQRYYEKTYDYDVVAGTTTYVGGSFHGGGNTTRTTGYIAGGNNNFRTPKRDNPTIVLYDQAGNSGKVQRYELGVSGTENSSAAVSYAAHRNFMCYSNTGSNATGIMFHFTAESEL